MWSYPVSEFSEIIQGSLIGQDDSSVDSVIIDSRTSAITANTAFFALKGPNHDGHRYVQQLIKKGIRVFVVQNDFEPEEDVTYIRVNNTLKALQMLASHCRKRFSGKVIAITGSNGKTIVKEWLASVLSDNFTISKNPKSYNSQVGVPLSILQANPHADLHIFEAGISEPGEMIHLQKMLIPDYGLITNIGDAHQENFLSRKEKLKEKLILFKNAERIYYSADQQDIASELKQMEPSGHCRLLSWGAGQEAEMCIQYERPDNAPAKIISRFNNQEFIFEFPFKDQASLENGSHLVLMALDLGVKADTLARKLRNLESVAMRMQQTKGINGCTLINDFYNSDYQSIHNAIDLLIQQTHQTKKTLIISDVLQSGDPPEIMVEKIHGIVENKGFTKIIGIGPAMAAFGQNYTSLTAVYPSTSAFLNNINPGDFSEEAILLKAARDFRFEQISARLEEKIHRTILRIHMPTMLDNLNVYRRHLNKKTRIMGMVKAFSYGSGSHEVARFLAHQNIDYLAVAFIDEGVELRKAGVKTPIMVMNPDFNRANTLIQFDLEPEIFNPEGLRLMKSRVSANGVRHFPVHLKIDTGMHRLGFQKDQLAENIDDFSNPMIRIASIFSHLAAASDPKEDDFTNKQISSFVESCNYLSDHLPYHPLRHILNTSGIERFSQAQFDMVRLGIGLYGIGGEEVRGLESPVLFQSYISQIQEIQAGDSVGYDRKGKLPEGGKIGIVPVGYADGFDRRLGNGQWTMTAGKWQLKTIGQICMDMCMVDLTGTDVKEGQMITIIESKEGIQKMADILHTIPYEILTGFSARINRVYEFE